VVEDVHFTRDTSPQKIGRKALARCFSDIAAMGGRPTAAVVTLGLPAEFSPELVEALYSGMRDLASTWQTAIVGGETVRNPAGLFISVALIGLVQRNAIPTRSGAKAGDAIFVTGTLGGSLAGKHLDFEPRLAEGQWLSQNFSIHSMIDLSDGLAGDLRHILEASGVGAELRRDSIPVSQAARLRARENGAGKPPLLAALTDGEDFELLLTVSSHDAVRLLDAWKEKFPDQKLTCIGRIESQPGLRLRDSEGLKTLSVHGYTHFS
jgi:thiamine-monophosphate kinase